MEKVTTQLRSVSLRVDEDATEEQINQTIDEKIAAARARLSPTQCLFCTSATPAATLEENLMHMSAAHSFFVPDAEYLVDLVGRDAGSAQRLGDRGRAELVRRGVPEGAAEAADGRAGTGEHDDLLRGLHDQLASASRCSASS